MKIGFVGTGKLGMPCALAVNYKGHEVFAYDVDPECMQKERFPHKERDPFNNRPTIVPLLRESSIQFVPLASVIHESEIIFVSVQTPHAPQYEGITRLPAERVDFDYTYLINSIREISNLVADLDEQKIVVIISTVLPGTIRREILPIIPENLLLVYNPFFIAMGTTIQDFLSPEFVLLGVNDVYAKQRVFDFYKTLVTDELVSWDDVSPETREGKIPCVETTLDNAELIKVLYNCFSGDTKVSLLDGSEQEIKSLVGTGKHWFYGCFEGKIIPVVGEAVVGKRAQRLVSVTLDNREIVRCTPDHKWLMRDGQYRKAKDLRPGDSLMPLYRRPSTKEDDKVVLNYEMYLDPVDKSWRFTHRMLDHLIPAVHFNGEEFEVCERTKEHVVRHHLDLDYSNNCFENLVWVTWGDHNNYHRRFASQQKKAWWRNHPEEGQRLREKISSKMKERWRDPEYRKLMQVFQSENLSKVWKAKWSDPVWREKMKGVSRENMLKLLSDPVFVEALRKRSSERSKSLHADPNSKLYKWQHSEGYKQTFIRLGQCVICREKMATGMHLKTHDLTYKSYQELHNHKVVSVVASDVEDTYCIKVVHPCHNFALSAGVFVHNTYITGKISMINTAMEVCHKSPNTDVDSVTKALILGNRRIISPSYLQGGLGDGGGCHPRDCVALSWLSRKLDLSYDWFEHLMLCRENQTEWLADLILEQCRLHNLPIHLLGRSFKPETNLTIGSPAVLLEALLKEHEFEVISFDPNVTYVDVEGVDLAAISQDYVRMVGAAIYFIGTKHECFRRVKFPSGSVVIDPWRFIDQDQSSDVELIRVGDSISNARRNH